MKKIFKALGKMLLSGVIAVLALSLFCRFYSYFGCWVTNKDGDTRFKHLPNTLMCSLTEGMCYKYTDENGFFNEKGALSYSPQILLMGDSHMEACMIPTKDTVASRLNKYYSTYNIGISSHEIQYCVEDLNDALRVHAPTDYVIIQTSFCNIDKAEMEKVINGTIPPHTGHSAAEKAVVSILPALRILNSQLTRWIEASDSFLPEKSDADVSSKTENNAKQIDGEYAYVMDMFLKKASESAKKGNVDLIIFRMPPLQLETDGSFAKEDPAELKATELFRKSCIKNDIIFVDMMPAFQKEYKEHHRLPRGFCNSVLGEGHLNKTGQRVVAEVLQQTIDKLQK